MDTVRQVAALPAGRLPDHAVNSATAPCWNRCRRLNGWVQPKALTAGHRAALPPAHRPWSAQSNYNVLMELQRIAVPECAELLLSCLENIDAGPISVVCKASHSAIRQPAGANPAEARVPGQRGAYQEASAGLRRHAMSRAASWRTSGSVSAAEIARRTPAEPARSAPARRLWTACDRPAPYRCARPCRCPQRPLACPIRRKLARPVAAPAMLLTRVCAGSTLAALPAYPPLPHAPRQLRAD